MAISTLCRGRIRSALSFVTAVILLLGLAGCGSPTETYHNEEYGFSLSIDKELMEYMFVEAKAPADTGEVEIDFYYHEEWTEPVSDGVEAPLLTEAIFFKVFVEPAGTAPQDSRLQLLGSDDRHSFYFWTLDMNGLSFDTMVQERWDQYADAVYKIPATFSTDQ